MVKEINELTRYINESIKKINKEYGKGEEVRKYSIDKRPFQTGKEPQLSREDIRKAFLRGMKKGKTDFGRKNLNDKKEKEETYFHEGLRRIEGLGIAVGSLMEYYKTNSPKDLVRTEYGAKVARLKIPEGIKNTIRNYGHSKINSREKSNLESITAQAASIIAITAGIFFLSPNITGNAVANMAQKTSNGIGAILFVAGLIGIYLWKKKTNSYISAADFLEQNS